MLLRGVCHRRYTSTRPGSWCSEEPEDICGDILTTVHTQADKWHPCPTPTTGYSSEICFKAIPFKALKIRIYEHFTDTCPQAWDKNTPLPMWIYRIMRWNIFIPTTSTFMTSRQFSLATTILEAVKVFPKLYNFKLQIKQKKLVKKVH